MIKDILPPLIITLLIELPIAVIWGLRKKDLALCALVNLLTNPLVNLLYLFFPYVWALWGFECAAVAGEWLLYRKLGSSIKRPLALSVTANAISFFLGGILLFFLQAYFWRWFR